MADYVKEEIIKDYLETGEGKYSSFHAKRKKEADARGDKYPALMTFRKMLEEAGHLEETSKKEKVSVASASSESMVYVDKDYLDFLESFLPESVRENSEVHFLKWQVGHLKSKLAQRNAEKKEDAEK